MSATWKIVIAVVVSLLLVAGGYWLFERYRSIHGPQSAAVGAISDDAVFFLQSTDVRASLYKLMTETGYWEHLLDDDRVAFFQHRFELLDSLISLHAGISELVELNFFTLSFNKTSQQSYGFIYLLELPPGDYSGTIENFIREVNGEQSIILRKQYNKAWLHTVNLSGPEELFYYTVYHGLFIGSHAEDLVKNAVDRLQTRTNLLDDVHFLRVYQTAGKNVEANLFIRLPNFMEWAGIHLKEEALPWTEYLLDLGYWAELDVLVNHNDLLLNGYTITTDSAGKILNRFRQTPQAVRTPEVLPYNINWMVHWGLDDIRMFLNSTPEPDRLREVFSAYRSTYGIDLDAELLSWVGSEVCLASVPHSDKQEGHVVVIHSSDVVKAALSLGSMEARVNRKHKTQPVQINYKDYNIRQLGLTDLFMEVFGKPFPALGGCHYMVLKDYLVFAENKELLMQVIDDFYARRTLQENANYQDFSDNISDRSNIYIYANPGATGAIEKHLSGNQVASGLAGTFGQFEGIALQFSYFNQMFYTNMFVSYNPEHKDVVITDWQALLEADCLMKPRLVRNHRSGKTNVLVFDRSNNLYLVDHVGRIQWQLPLIEPPLGDVYLVDFYNNDKVQYLFNTANYIYLVDLNGNYVADFPRKLPAPSTSPVVVLDYDDNNDYRLLLAFNDNRIHNFTLQLEAVEGWSMVQGSAAITQAVQYLSKAGKDYLFISDEKGMLKITDRRGLDRGSPGAKVMKARHSEYYINRTNNKGVFLTTDEKGKVVYIDEKGKLKRTDFGDFSPDHYFFYEDFNQDDHNDFIFIDENSMQVYDRFKNLIVSNRFEEKIIYPPQMFTWAGRKYIGVVFPVAGEIRIFDHQGRRFTDRHIEGNIPFEAGSLENGKLNLITGMGAKVMNYQLN